jgi:transposase
VADHPTLTMNAAALSRARAVLMDEFITLDKKVHTLARQDPRARLLTTAPGVGSVVALTYAAAIDDPSRFKSSKTVGALFGLTPKRYQSGETDVAGQISKIGDAAVRTALYEAANIILERPGQGRMVGRPGRWRWPSGQACARPRWRWRASWRWCCTACWWMGTPFNPEKAAAAA